MKNIGLFLRHRHQLLAVLALEDEMRRACRSNYDVSAIAGFVEAAEFNCLSIEFLRQTGSRDRRCG